MLPFRHSRIEDEGTAFLIEKIAYLSLYLFSVGLFFLIWDAYLKADATLVLIYAIVYLIYLIVTVQILLDIRKNYEFFEKSENIEGKKLIEEAHFLCANALCPRCGGWYVGLGISLALTLPSIALFKAPLLLSLQNLGISPFHLIGIGTILFLIATPFHGAWNFLKKIERFKKIDSSHKLKLVLGFASGLSAGLFAMGILMMLPG